MKMTFRCTLLALSCLLLLLLFGCSGGSDTATDPRIGFQYPDPADYRALTWTDAFKAAHDKFSREYASATGRVWIGPGSPAGFYRA